VTEPTTELKEPTDIVLEGGLVLPEGPEGSAAVQVPLWRIRLRLLRNSAVHNWKLFARNKIGIIGLGIILVFALMALAHPILMSTVWGKTIYDPVVGHDAPRQLFEVVATPADIDDPLTQMDLTTARLRSTPNVQVGGTVDLPLQPAPPSRAHLLGTDPLGRDVMSQLLFSTRAAFALGFIAAIVTVFVATTVGAMAAYYGGWLDSLLMRFADLVLLVPLIPLLIVVSTLFTLTLPLLGVLIGVLSGFGGTAIILKSQALSVTVKPFIDAARVSGGSNRHIIMRHIIPNVLPLSFLYMMFTVTGAIGLEAVLSFFGLLHVPMSWGLMIGTSHSQGYLLSGTYWWLLVPAGGSVTLLSAAFYLVGRAMDEVVNPKLRRR
jgi:peptide/nickel transport system permease protein